MAPLKISCVLGESIDLILGLAPLDLDITTIIDALDECELMLHQGLLETLIKISKEAPDLVKVFKSSWEGKGYKTVLGRIWESLCEASDDQEDILHLVMNKLHQPITEETLYIMT